eukprot:1085187-Rhodomonas_salina.2
MGGCRGYGTPQKPTSTPMVACPLPTCPVLCYMQYNAAPGNGTGHASCGVRYCAYSMQCAVAWGSAIYGTCAVYRNEIAYSMCGTETGYGAIQCVVLRQGMGLFNVWY